MQQKAGRLLQFYNGNQIPQIGYGTYQLKGEDCIQGVTYALKIGYRHIDSASIYQNGVSIGKVLKKVGIPRNEIFITSKISPGEQGYQKSLDACSKILSDLEIDYLDCLLIHWPGVAGLKPEDPQNSIIRLETYKALEQLQKEGLVRNIGVSNFLLRHLKHLLENSSIKPVLNQFEIHPLCYDVPTIQFCQQNNILIEAYSPLARQDPKLLENPIMKELALKYKKSICQISLRWAYQKDFIVLPKSKREQFIKENLEIEDYQISQEDMGRIDSLNEGYHTCWDPEKVLY